MKIYIFSIDKTLEISDNISIGKSFPQILILKGRKNEKNFFDNSVRADVGFRVGVYGGRG